MCSEIHFMKIVLKRLVITDKNVIGIQYVCFAVKPHKLFTVDTCLRIIQLPLEHCCLVFVWMWKCGKVPKVHVLIVFIFKKYVNVLLTSVFGVIVSATVFLACCWKFSHEKCIKSTTRFFAVILLGYFPSVLWRCWLGVRKGIRPVKNWVVGCWRGCLHGVQTCI